MNRRISLVVLNDKTERQIRGLPEEPIEEIESESDAAEVFGVGEPESAEPPAAPAEPQPAGDRLAQPAPGSNPA
jgi:hypothetical protein